MGRGRKKGAPVVKTSFNASLQNYKIMVAYLYDVDDEGNEFMKVVKNDQFLTKTKFINMAIAEYIENHLDVKKTTVTDEDGNTAFKYIVSEKTDTQEDKQGFDSPLSQSGSSVDDLDDQDKLLAKAAEFGIDLSEFGFKS